ncbi:MAG: hypothetical protein WA082_01345 [Candidatus Moraniibacteriota bacterium]
MQEIRKRKENLEKTIAEFFPEAKAAIVYGSNGDQYIPGVSDIDLVVIGPENNNVEGILETLHGSRPEVDPVYISENDLAQSKFKGKALEKSYELHKFDLYRIKRQGKLLFGDSSILNLFPEVNLRDALLDTLPHIKEVFIPRLRDGLEGQDNPENFLAENIGIILVVVRAIYSIETGQYGSKIMALEYLQNRYPDFAELLEHIKKLYLRQNTQNNKFFVNDIKSLLDLALKKFDTYLTETNQPY